MTRFVSRNRWYLIVVAAVLAAIAVLVASLAAFEDARNGLGRALVGGALEIAFVGLIGGVLTNAIKEQLAQQEDRRRQQAAALEEHRRINEYRMRLLLDVVAAYHRVKHARRSLRAAGFEQPSGAQLEQWQIVVYWDQLSEITEAELALGKIERELKVDLGQLTERAAIRAHVAAAADYLDEIIEGWEARAVGVAQGDVAAVTAQETLARLLSHDKGATSFIGGISAHMDAIELAIRTDMDRAVPRNASSR